MEQRIGRYQLLEEVGAGGQGAVYRAFDPETGQIVALKVLHPHPGDAVHLERFLREARMASSIDHPNVIRVFEVGSDRGSHYISMEYLPESLARVIESGGPLPIERSVEFASQIVSGLGAAHALGIVHRDIKPHNVLIGPDGNLKITDFGIARAEMLRSMTATGAIMGSSRYMSAERARGERGDHRSDLYAVGIVLYEMLTGKVPFDGDTHLEILEMQREATPPKVRQARRDVPAQLEAVVDRCLEKDPNRRYQTADQLALALEQAVPEADTVRPAPGPRLSGDTHPVTETPVKDPADSSTRTRSQLPGVRAWLRFSTGAAVVALLFGSGAYLFNRSPTSPEAPIATPTALIGVLAPTPTRNPSPNGATRGSPDRSGHEHAVARIATPAC